MPTSNTEELGRFLKCTVIGRGVFGPCACCLNTAITEKNSKCRIQIIGLCDRPVFSFDDIVVT